MCFCYLEKKHWTRIVLVKGSVLSERAVRAERGQSAAGHSENFRGGLDCPVFRFSHCFPELGYCGSVVSGRRTKSFLSSPESQTS